MTTPIYYDNDANLSLIQGKRVAFIGYGNQGAAQAQNLRDSGVSQIVIGNRDDEYKEAALKASFRVVSIPEAAAEGEVVFLLIFSEQAVWPTILLAMQTAYEILHEAGFSDEAILYEMYLSKEPAEVFERFAEQGVFGQLTLHSHTSQYGQLRALLAWDSAALRERFVHVLHDNILSGAFAREWSDVQAKDSNRLEEMRAKALTSPLAQAENEVMKRTHS